MMRKANDIMNEFINNLRDMKKYQGIDITNPSTYSNREQVHEAYKLEKTIVSTQEKCDEIQYIEMKDELEK
mgnify:FL=1